ncbi:tripartite tricarboxylate transporter TctB family protein [Maliponia aquimaris]|uniref:Tripartite tricarboxylate transporter TctB family protein n=1 Tax=Maliponia aquimaris TaxID=1673631 RepID=A0A238KNP4_9RHOB|nr:tripartite tricarboxylate transporter TctB family protein [Maliponia aquimaris]SMX44474.1 Tripartite tricarboxylate transporter TctB family protein [Maliponia aquimaris]
MRIVFALVLLAGAVFYTYVAFVDLSFLTRTGRLGPGFFPRVIGVTAIVVCLLITLDEMRRSREPNGDNSRWRDAVALIALGLLYAVLMRLFGGFVATVIFLGLALTVVNPGRHLTNGLVSVLVPIAVYLLFDRLLNASMPPALYSLPI